MHACPLAHAICARTRAVVRRLVHVGQAHLERKHCQSIACRQRRRLRGGAVKTCLCRGLPFLAAATAAAAATDAAGGSCASHRGMRNSTPRQLCTQRHEVSRAGMAACASSGDPKAQSARSEPTNSHLPHRSRLDWAYADLSHYHIREVRGGGEGHMPSDVRYCDSGAAACDRHRAQNTAGRRGSQSARVQHSATHQPSTDRARSVSMSCAAFSATILGDSGRSGRDMFDPALTRCHLRGVK